MARRNNDPTSGADKAKVRVFFAEVEGNNDSVQEALKTMVSAMSRPVRVISEQKTNGEAVLLAQQSVVEEIDERGEQPEEVAEVGEESSSLAARKARGTGKKVDRNSGLNLVPDLNFRPSGKQTLKEFVEEKGPTSDLEARKISNTLSSIVRNHVDNTAKRLGSVPPAKQGESD